MRIELHGRERCQYQLANPLDQPLGRIGEFLRPMLLDPQTYLLQHQVHLVGRGLVGVGRDRRIVEETLHLQELEARQRLSLRLRSLLPPREPLQGAVCSLVDNRRWCGSFFHWFLDCLPRLLAASDHRRRTGERCRVIVPARLTAWQEASLELLGISALERLPERAGPPVVLVVERLIASVAHRWQRLGDAPFDALSPWTLRQLAAELGRAIPPAPPGTPRRLYLSRRGVLTRQVANEAEVLALLEPHGFVALQSEKLSLAEQIALFRGASHIVAPHGASLTNLLHSRGGSVLELFQGAHGVRPDFFQLAMLNGISYYHALCPSSGPLGHCEVPLEVVRRFLALTL